MAFLITTACTVATATLHNYFAEGDWILVSWNSGSNFYSGNNPTAIGLPTPLPGVSQDRRWRPLDERLVVGRILGVNPSARVVSTYWTEKTVNYIRKNPGSFARLLLRKLRLAISGMENSHMYYFSFEKTLFTPFLAVFFLQFLSLFPIGSHRIGAFSATMATLLFSLCHDWRNLHGTSGFLRAQPPAAAGRAFLNHIRSRRHAAASPTAP